MTNFRTVRPSNPPESNDPWEEPVRLTDAERIAAGQWGDTLGGVKEVVTLTPEQKAAIIEALKREMFRQGLIEILNEEQSRFACPSTFSRSLSS